MYGLTLAASVQSRKGNSDTHRHNKRQAQGHVLLAILSRLLDNSARPITRRHVSVGSRRIPMPQIPMDTLPRRNYGRLPVQHSNWLCMAPGKTLQYTAFNRSNLTVDWGGKGIRHLQTHIPKPKHIHQWPIYVHASAPIFDHEMMQQAYNDKILNTLLATYKTDAWVSMMTKMKELHLDRRDLEQDYDSVSNVSREQIKAINIMNGALNGINTLVAPP